jgi:hypothetical protein
MQNIFKLRAVILSAARGAAHEHVQRLKGIAE